jgi:Ferric reductase like transmembrane component
MLPVSKNSVLQLLLGISYTGAMGFHKLMGWFFVIVSVVHVGVYLKSASVDPAHSLVSHMFNMHDEQSKASMSWGEFRSWL